MKTETNFTQRTLRIRRVADKTGVPESSIWRLAQRGDFPPPIKLSPGCTAWYEHEIDEWLDAKAAERNSPSEPIDQLGHNGGPRRQSRRYCSSWYGPRPTGRGRRRGGEVSDAVFLGGRFCRQGRLSVAQPGRHAG